MVGCDYHLTGEHSMKVGQVVHNNKPEQTGVLNKEKYEQCRKNMPSGFNDSYNKIKNISGLAGYGQLNTVLMDYNSISAVNALSSCHNLIKVSVYGNPVKDVSKLTEMSVIVNYNPTK